jgi:hypothetical protein
VGKLYRGRDYLRVGDRRGLYQSRSELPKSRRPARIVSEVGTTKGWVCEVAEEDSDWLGSLTGPHTKGVWTGRYARLCSKALISYGYKWPPLQSVQKVSRYSLFQEGAMNAAGKEPIEALINL